MYPGRRPTNEQVLENFVVLEGLDGSGTTTQLELLGRRLSSRGVPHFCTGEPTTSAIGRQIRSILKQEIRVDPRTVALLFAADRNEHLHQPDHGILAHLERGELVVSDRYLFSSLAYQSLGCPFEYVRELNRPFPLPRLVLFLDTPVSLSQERLSRRASVTGSPGGRPDGQPDGRPSGRPCAGGEELFDRPDLQPRIQAAYQRAFALFRGTGMEVLKVDGSRGAEEVFENIWTILRRLPILMT
jgi:dTMP kinase